MYILFVSSQRKLAPDYNSFEGLSAAGEAEDGLPPASWGPYPFRVPPAGEFQVQGFLPLGNELLTYLLSNNPADSGILPLPTFSASGTFSSSPVHLTRGFLPSLKRVSGRDG